MEIADGITRIGDLAFSGCSSLTGIAIPDSVTSIGNYAFYGCGSLTKIVLPKQVASIGIMSFLGCTNLESINIPEQVDNIGDSAFSGCSSLAHINLPPSVTDIGQAAFVNCTSLASIVLPDGISDIKWNTFYGCTSLASVEIPASVVSIAEEAFVWCNALTEVSFDGTMEQWRAIAVDTGNDPLNSATIHCTDGDIDPLPNPQARAAALSDLVAPNYGSTDMPADTTPVRTIADTLLPLAGKFANQLTEVSSNEKASQWYIAAASWANRQKIGYGNGVFGTKGPVARRQAEANFQYGSNGYNVKLMRAAGHPTTPAAMILANLTQADQPVPGTLSIFSAMNIMCGPGGIALERDDSLLVTDLYHKQVWRVANRDSDLFAGGTTVQDLYGQPIGGYNDAELEGSYFKTPWAIAPFLDGWAVSDADNNAVRLISSDGVQTLNGSTKEKLSVTELGVAFQHPTGLAADSEGNLYISDTFAGAVCKVTPDGSISTAAKNLSYPMGLCWKDGALYIAETGANRIIKMEDGKTVRVAGSGLEGLDDGPAAQSTFSSPQGVAVGEDGSLYIADTVNGAIRMVKDGVVSTLTVAAWMRWTAG